VPAGRRLIEQVMVWLLCLALYKLSSGLATCVVNVTITRCRRGYASLQVVCGAGFNTTPGQFSSETCVRMNREVERPSKLPFQFQANSIPVPGKLVSDVRCPVAVPQRAM